MVPPREAVGFSICPLFSLVCGVGDAGDAGVSICPLFPPVCVCPWVGRGRWGAGEVSAVLVFSPVCLCGRGELGFSICPLSRWLVYTCVYARACELQSISRGRAATLRKR